MSSFFHVDNKKEDILIIGKGPAQLEHTLTAEKCIQLILPNLIQNFASVFIIMKQNSYLFINAT